MLVGMDSPRSRTSTPRARAAIDGLSGALRRDLLSDALAAALAAAKAESRACSVLMLDIDHFKSVNDAFGHTRGDAAIREVASRVLAITRRADRLFRFGGDEFLLLMPNTPLRGAAELAERILASVRAGPVLAPENLSVTLSIGVAAFPNDAQSPDGLLEKADSRCYIAKRKGRGQAVAVDGELPPPQHGESTRLIERDDAIKLISDYLSAIAAPGPAAPAAPVVVAGPAGAGHSALLKHAALHAAKLDIAVVNVLPSARHSAQPLGALWAALGFPTDRQRSPRPPHHTARADEIIQRVQQRAGEHALLILVDDTRHLDPASHRLLQQLVLTPRVGVVITAQGPLPAWSRTPLRIVNLTPLSSQGLRVWLRVLLQAEPQDAFLAWVGSATHFLPKHIAALTAQLMQSGAISRDGDAWRVAPDFAARLSDNTVATAATPPRSGFAAKLERTIAAHIADADFGVAELADALHMDRTTLFKRIKAAGLPPALAQIRAQRLEVAAALLRDRSSPAHAAHATGFASLSHFATNFKARFGQTPTEYSAAVGAVGRAHVDAVRSRVAQDAPRAGQIPPQFDSFIGRASEMAELTTLIQTHRLVTLTGAGGAGKTRLAIELAQRLASRYARGAAWVPLADARSEDDLLPAMAVALGLPGMRPGSAAAVVAAAFGNREQLVVLDNCEHVIQAAAHAANVLLTRCSGIRILATSREALNIPGELAWRVPSLAVPAEMATLGEVSIDQFSAVELFVERATAAQKSFTLNAVNSGAVATICRRLDGIPLAIELAAARVKLLSPQQIADRLDTAFQWLGGGHRVAQVRQQTLKALIDWSHNLLTPAERALFRRVAVFVGGFTLEHCENACGANPLAPEAVLEVLARLVDKSLVVAEAGASRTRYRLLETIRQYAREQLDQSGEAASVARRHAEYFAAWAERAEPMVSGPHQSFWLAELEADIDNLRAAINFGELHAPPIALSISRALWRFWDLRGRLPEGLDRLTRALAATPNAAPSVRALALAHAAFMARNLEDYRTAARLAGDVMSLGDSLEFRHARAIAEFVLGACQLEFNQPQAGVEALQRACTEFEALGQHGFAGTALIFLGFEAEQRNDLRAARRLMERGLAEVRRSGETRRIAHGLVRLGFVALGEGDARRAESLYAEALALAQTTADHAYLVNATFLLGRVALFLEQYERADRLLADPILMSDRTSLAEQGWALAERAKLAWARGNTSEHRAHAVAALARAEAARVDELIATSAWLLAAAAQQDGHPSEVQQYLRQALECFAKSRREGRCLCLELAATLAAAAGEFDRAAQLMGVRHTLRAVRFPLDHYPFMQRQRESLVAQIKAVLGDADYHDAFARGETLTENDAVALALPPADE